MRKKFWVTGISVSAFLAVIMILFILHPAVARASSSGFVVSVKKVRFIGQDSGSAFIGRDENVVGFSCTADNDGTSECFIATR